MLVPVDLYCYCLLFNAFESNDIINDMLSLIILLNDLIYYLKALFIPRMLLKFGVIL